MSTKSDLAVERSGEIFELQAGESLRPGDRIINKGTDAATVGTVSKSLEHPSQVATLKPGQSVRVTDVGRPEDAVLGLEAVEADTLVTDAPAEIAAAADFAVNPEVEMLEEAQGLFGAVPFLAGGAGLAAAAGAVGLAAVAGSSGSDDSGSDNGAGTTSPSDTAGGLAGGLNQLNDALEQTPLGAVTTLTGALADGLATAGQALSNAGEPTGLAATLGEVIGTPGSGGAGGLVSTNGSLLGNTGNAGESGVVGLVNTVSTSLDNAVSNGPLEPLAQVVNPLTQTLGASAGQVDGLAQGLANVGSTLINDTSVLSPLTADLLGPVVGSSSGQDGGLPQTLTQLGEGLTDLTNPASALAPLNALTDPISDSVLTQLAAGAQTIGDGLAGFAAQDPSGVSALLSDLFGGTVSGATDPAANPLGGLTSLLDGGLLGGGLLGGGLDGGLLGGLTDSLPGADALTGTGGLLGALPLSADALPGADALTGTGGLLGALPLSADALPVPTDALGGLGNTGDLLGAAGGLSGISSGAGLPGLDTVTNLLPF